AVIDHIEQATGKKMRYSLQRPRPGDQLFYVTDFDKLTEHTGWKPRISVRQNIQMICDWCKEQCVAPELMPIIHTPESVLVQIQDAASGSSHWSIRPGHSKARSISYARTRIIRSSWCLHPTKFN